MDAAYSGAEQNLLDQRLFYLSVEQYWAFLEMLDRPEFDNLGLAKLFALRPFWDNTSH